MALITFLVVIGSGMKKLGRSAFGRRRCRTWTCRRLLKIFLVPMIFVIEVFGLLVKHGVLAVRLLANMMARARGAGRDPGVHRRQRPVAVVVGVMPASVLGATALSMLELFVAFLQAYIFTFLSALFIGMAVHPH